jgi:hypothetical protein
MIPRLIRRLAAVVATLLLISACGSDDPLESSSDAEMSDDEMSEGEHEHGHDEADAIVWDGAEVPELQIAVTGDADSGWDIEATVSGFTFSELTAVDHVAGSGHSHVFLDGQLVTMSYEPTVHVDTLAPGPHQAMVKLSRNDHADYSLDGELIMATATFTVAGEVDEADVNVAVTFEGGEVTGVETPVAVSAGDLVELTVHSDSAQTVHVHGYELFLDVAAGEMADLRFDALIVGSFEVEFEESGLLLFELDVS